MVLITLGWVCWSTALKKDGRGTIAQGTVHHVGVASDPPQVSNTSKYVSRLIVKHILSE